MMILSTDSSAQPHPSQIQLTSQVLQPSAGSAQGPAQIFLKTVVMTMATTLLSLGTVVAIGSSSGAQSLRADSLRQQISSTDTIKRSAAFEQLSRVGASNSLESQTAVLILSDALANSSPEVRHSAAVALRSIGTGAEAAFPALKLALQDPNPKVRRSAVLAIRSIDAGEAIPDLIARLDDSDPTIRSVTAEALATTGYHAQAAIQKLIDIVDRDLDSDARSSAALAIARIDLDLRSSGTATPEQVAATDRIIVPALSRALEDPSWIVRRAAADAISSIAGKADVKETIPRLRNALKDKNRTLRSYGAIALGTIGKDAAVAIPDLSQTLGDTSPYVRGNTASALGKILATVDQFGTVEQTALQQLIQTLGDPELIVRSNALSVLKDVAEHLESMVEMNGFDVDQAIAEVGKAKALISDPKFGYTKTDIASVERRLNRLQDQKARRAVINHIVQNPWVWGPAVYLIVLFGLFWLRPVWLLYIEKLLSGLKIPGIKIPGIDVEVPFQCLLLLLQYHPRVLDAWVSLNLAGARQAFGSQTTVQKREVHISIPVTLEGKDIPHLTNKELRSTFKKHLLILGEGGSGKTSLACQIASWAMAEKPEDRLCDHPMIPVLIEEELDFDETTGKEAFAVLKRAMLGKLQDMIAEQQSISEDLFNHLLEHKRILLLVDHFSEMSEKMQKVIRPNDPDFPANAVIITARTEEALESLTNRTVLQPQRVRSDRLVFFMENYFKRSNCDLFTEAKLLDACSRLSSMVGNRQITVLLAKMYADQIIQMIEDKVKSAPDVLDQMPKSIPDLMLEYINELNDVEENRVDDDRVHHDAKVIAWECLKTSYQPMPALRSDVEAALGENAALRLRYLEERLQLIQIKKGSGKDKISFLLDPLSEYLAALRMIELYGQDAQQWQAFLDRINSQLYSPTTVAGFLMAVRDCCVTEAGQDANVPSFVVVRLNQILAELNLIPNQAVLSPNPASPLDPAVRPDQPIQLSDSLVIPI